MYSKISQYNERERERERFNRSYLPFPLEEISDTVNSDTLGNVGFAGVEVLM